MRMSSLKVAYLFMKDLLHPKKRNQTDPYSCYSRHREEESDGRFRQSLKQLLSGLLSFVSAKVFCAANIVVKKAKKCLSS